MVRRVIGPFEDFQAVPHSPQVSWLVLGLCFPVLKFGFSYRLLAGRIGCLHGRVTKLNVLGRGLPLLKEEVLGRGLPLLKEEVLGRGLPLLKEEVLGRGLTLLKEEVLLVGFPLFLDCQFAGQVPPWVAPLA